MTIKDLLNSKVYFYRDFNAIIVKYSGYDFRLFQNKSSFLTENYGKYNCRVSSKLLVSLYDKSNKTNLEDKL